MNSMGEWNLTPIFVLSLVGAFALLAGAGALFWWLMAHLAWVP